MAGEWMGAHVFQRHFLTFRGHLSGLVMPFRVAARAFGHIPQDDWIASFARFL